MLVTESVEIRWPSVNKPMDGPMDKPMDRKRDEEREDHVRCIIVTCVAANGTEDVLLTRYFDGSTPAAQVMSPEERQSQVASMRASTAACE